MPEDFIEHGVKRRFSACAFSLFELLWRELGACDTNEPRLRAIGFRPSYRSWLLRP